MKKSLYLILPAVFAFNVTCVSALEIDEKLTLRFLKISSTKKTILINRGGEDGLVVGDHAKFFITAGVIARGVAEKVSPSRSVWSLYRIVDPNEITQDKVLNLKISSPVKITDDPSKSLKEEVIPGGSDTLQVEPGTEGEATEDTDVNTINDTDKAELRDLGGAANESDAEVDDELASLKEVKKTKPVKTANNKRSKNMSTTSSSGSTRSVVDTNRDWEAWGSLALTSLNSSATSTAANSETETGSVKSGMDLTGAVEKYFFKSNNFLKDMSLSLILHKTTLETGSTTDKASADLFEYGAGASYHFYNPPGSISKPIGFVTGTFGLGTASLTDKSATATSTAAIEGSTKFFSVGGGVKYLFDNGFGIRGSVEYYNSSQEYAFEADSTGASVTETVTVNGPRVQLGVSYRF